MGDWRGLVIQVMRIVLGCVAGDERSGHLAGRRRHLSWASLRRVWRHLSRASLRRVWWHLTQASLCRVWLLPPHLYRKEPQTALGEPHPHPYGGEALPLPTLPLPVQSQGYTPFSSEKMAPTARIMPTVRSLWGFDLVGHIWVSDIFVTSFNTDTLPFEVRRVIFLEAIESFFYFKQKRKVSWLSFNGKVIC